MSDPSRPRTFRCRLCRTRFREAIFVSRRGRLMVSNSHARHIEGTHGIPREVLVELADNHIRAVMDGLIRGPVDVTVLE